MPSRYCVALRHLGCVAILAVSSAHYARAATDELICLKSDDPTSLSDMAIACYSEQACAYVEQHKGEPLPDYDIESVAAALGREKIEGIITSSKPIIKQVTGYGYKCRPQP